MKFVAIIKLSPGICFEGLRKPTKKSVQDSYLRTLLGLIIIHCRLKSTVANLMALQILTTVRIVTLVRNRPNKKDRFQSGLC